MPLTRSVGKENADGKSWNEAHHYTPPDIKGGAQGLRDGVVGLVAP